MVRRFEAETQSCSRQFQANTMKVYMDSMVLVVVNWDKFQSTKKGNQHLTLKNNCEEHWSHIFGYFLRF